MEDPTACVDDAGDITATESLIVPGAYYSYSVCGSHDYFTNTMPGCQGIPATYIRDPEKPRDRNPAIDDATWVFAGQPMPDTEPNPQYELDMGYCASMMSQSTYAVDEFGQSPSCKYFFGASPYKAQTMFYSLLFTWVEPDKCPVFTAPNVVSAFTPDFSPWSDLTVNYRSAAHWSVLPCGGYEVFNVRYNYPYFKALTPTNSRFTNEVMHDDRVALLAVLALMGALILALMSIQYR